MRKDTNNGQERPMTQKEKNRQEQFEKLLQLSARARVIRTKMVEEAKNEYEAIAISALPLNVIITKHIYAKETGATEFRKFKEWKDDGYNIIKGSKGYPVWSVPMQRESKMTVEKEGEKEEKTFHTEHYNMCYLFSNLQVEKAETNVN